MALMMVLKKLDRELGIKKLYHKKSHLTKPNMENPWRSLFTELKLFRKRYINSKYAISPITQVCRNRKNHLTHEYVMYLYLLCKTVWLKINWSFHLYSITLRYAFMQIPYHCSASMHAPVSEEALVQTHNTTIYKRLLLRLFLQTVTSLF